MPTKVAIRVRGLGKLYHIGQSKATGQLYDRLGARLGLGNQRARAENTIWALRKIDFEVPHGHVMGVLGRNGSGKSTLMRLLARVTAPTEGAAEVYGRVGALLQIGAGFHPELSGRDNIALSGAILGMSTREIAAFQEDIISFAEIDQFLETPVKHYSSGMYLRLAFSISAHLPTEIMLVDEVLSVGDAVFQEKCRNRIHALVADGRTVLLVSHSMSSVRKLCDSAIVLDGGRLRFQGGPEDAIDFYHREVLSGQ